MANVTVTRTVNAALPLVWESWNDFGNIYKFNPNLKASRLINNSKASGFGAMRQCDLADGKNYIRERVIKYEPMELMVIDIYDGTMPLKTAVATFTFMPTSQNTTNVSMSMEFTPKFGVFGKLMIPMMKLQFRKMLNSLLKGNADYVEEGREVRAVA